MPDQLHYVITVRYVQKQMLIVVALQLHYTTMLATKSV